MFDSFVCNRLGISDANWRLPVFNFGRERNNSERFGKQTGALEHSYSIKGGEF